jgi:hypothetical protein
MATHLPHVKSIGFWNACGGFPSRVRPSSVLQLFGLADLFIANRRTRSKSRHISKYLEPFPFWGFMPLKSSTTRMTSAKLSWRGVQRAKPWCQFT